MPVEISLCTNGFNPLVPIRYFSRQNHCEKSPGRKERVDAMALPNLHAPKDPLSKVQTMMCPKVEWGMVIELNEMAH